MGFLDVSWVVYMTGEVSLLLLIMDGCHVSTHMSE